MKFLRQLRRKRPTTTSHVHVTITADTSELRATLNELEARIAGMIGGRCGLWRY